MQRVLQPSGAFVQPMSEHASDKIGADRLSRNKELTTDLDEELESNDNSVVKLKMTDLTKSLKDLKSKTIRNQHKPQRGPYSIQVHVIEARELKGRGAGDMSDPVVRVECFGKQKVTSIKHATLNPRWEECLYFEITDLDPKQLQMERIAISVMDANTFRKDVLIGSYEFDASYVYFSDHHEIFRKWIGLTDLTDKYEGIQGYLKVSIVCLGPGDEQKIHTLEEIEELEQNVSDDLVLMPPQITQKGYVLNINVYCAQDLPKMDSGVLGGSCDPYVSVNFAGITVRSSVFENQLSPTFNEALQIAVMEPIMSDRIIFSIYDKDKFDKDDLIGTFTISYRMAKRGALKKPFWVNLYGAGENMRNQVAIDMAKNLIEGSQYRGRFLLSATVDRIDEPKSSDAPIKIGGVNFQEMLSNYVIQCDIYSLIESPLPSKSKIKIAFQCGEYSWESTEKSLLNGAAEFYEAITDDSGGINLCCNFPQDAAQVPDIFIYVIHKKEKICYFRSPFADLFQIGFENPPKWISFKQEISKKHFESSAFPGTLLIGLRTGLLHQLPAKFSTISRPTISVSSQKAEISSPKFDLETEGKTSAPSLDIEFGNLDIEVVQARDVLAVDKMSSSSDPYVKLTLGSKSVKTKHILKVR